MDRSHLDRLRATAALVHSTPGATLHIECRRRRSLLVGHGPSADLSPCQFRHVLAAEATATGSGVVSMIDSVSVGGTLEPLGAGIYCDSNATTGGGRRLASLLGPLLVEQVLRGVEVAGAEHRGVHAHLAPDPMLGVVCVHLGGPSTVAPEMLDDVALATAAALLAEEAADAARAAGSVGLGEPRERADGRRPTHKGSCRLWQSGPMVDVPDVLDLSARRPAVGCLMEKEATTPEVYPLTLKALTTACNQSTNRHPVVDYDTSLVENTVFALKSKGLARVVHPGSGERATKYRHVAAEALGLDAAEGRAALRAAPARPADRRRAEGADRADPSLRLHR